MSNTVLSSMTHNYNLSVASNSSTDAISLSDHIEQQTHVIFIDPDTGLEREGIIVSIDENDQYIIQETNGNNLLDENSFESIGKEQAEQQLESEICETKQQDDSSCIKQWINDNGDSQQEHQTLKIVSSSKDPSSSSGECAEERTVVLQGDDGQQFVIDKNDQLILLNDENDQSMVLQVDKVKEQKNHIVNGNDILPEDKSNENVPNVNINGSNRQTEIDQDTEQQVILQASDGQQFIVATNSCQQAANSGDGGQQIFLVSDSDESNVQQIFVTDSSSQQYDVCDNDGQHFVVDDASGEQVAKTSSNGKQFILATSNTWPCVTTETYGQNRNECLKDIVATRSNDSVTTVSSSSQPTTTTPSTGQLLVASSTGQQAHGVKSERFASSCSANQSLPMNHSDSQQLVVTRYEDQQGSSANDVSEINGFQVAVSSSENNGTRDENVIQSFTTYTGQNTNSQQSGVTIRTSEGAASNQDVGMNETNDDHLIVTNYISQHDKDGTTGNDNGHLESIIGNNYQQIDAVSTNKYLHTSSLCVLENKKQHNSLVSNRYKHGITRETGSQQHVLNTYNSPQILNKGNTQPISKANSSSEIGVGSFFSKTQSIESDMNDMATADEDDQQHILATNSAGEHFVLNGSRSKEVIVQGEDGKQYSTQIIVGDSGDQYIVVDTSHDDEENSASVNQRYRTDNYGSEIVQMQTDLEGPQAIATKNNAAHLNSRFELHPAIKQELSYPSGKQVMVVEEENTGQEEETTYVLIEPPQPVSHRAKSQKIKPFQCGLCRKEFVCKTNCMKHLHTHLIPGGKPYKCDRCGQAFGNLASLTDHLATHEGTSTDSNKERPYKCGMCGRVFSFAGSFTSHVRIHSTHDPIPEETVLEVTMI